MSVVHDVAAAALRGLDSETAHRLTVTLLRAGLGPRAGDADAGALAVELCGLRLPNCVGLAAGFDKDAQVADAMLAAGFGFVECGTVTPAPQAGNPRPRLFRLAEDRAVINRLGFNNKGLEAFARRLAARRRGGVVGANIGANKDSPDRIGDYVQGLEQLWGLADYFTVNISSPNTPGLRALQTRGALQELLGRLGAARAPLAAAGGEHPLFLKVAPDLEDDEIETIAEVTFQNGVQGLVVANTTLARPAGLRSPLSVQAGGLSGAPLMGPSTEILRRFHQAAGDRLALIGVGGVSSGADAYAKIRAGASAVQFYSAMVYDGPGLVGRIRRELSALLRADGFSTVKAAVGAN